jgi:hypothetical protein
MTKLIIWLIILAVAVAIGPLLTLWTLNTLFPALAIPYTWETWLAALFLGGILTTNVTNKK